MRPSRDVSVLFQIRKQLDFSRQAYTFSAKNARKRDAHFANSLLHFYHFRKEQALLEVFKNQLVNEKLQLDDVDMTNGSAHAR